jgi:hypothetical protein
MDGRLWKPDDGYTRWAVREIRHGLVVVRGREDVDCERSGAVKARIVAGGLGQWHGVAGREDSIAGGGGKRGGGERRGDVEQDDRRCNDDDGDDAGYYDDDDDDGG